MKKILITGAGSYIGTSFEKYINENYADKYTVDTVDMQDKNWKEKDFGGYDVVFHVAGLAHIKETKENAHLYYEINRDLAVETAKYAKEKGVTHFVFLSSMSVYGIEKGTITKETKFTPKSNYGKSKIEAEKQIKALENADFVVARLRPPMIYGEGCKGNYNSLIKFANKMPIFPNIRNQRSMCHIDKLCEYVVDVIEKKAGGVHFPQDEKYVCTSDMVKEIATKNGKKIRLTKILNPFVRIAMIMPGKIGKMAVKAFGSLKYEM